MKNRFKILYAFLGLVLLFSACTTEEFSQGKLIDKSELIFSVTPDTKDPNMIIIKSLTPGVTPLWVTPFGRSTRVVDTCKIAFPGTYKFIYGVESAGGYVQSTDTASIVIKTTNLSYVNDPLWTSLTGGVGKAKTWVSDNGKYGFAAGFMSYADPSVTQEYGNFAVNWDPGNATLNVTNDDLSGSMTFDLIGGPHLTVVKPNEPGASTKGTYFFDAKGHTLSTTDVTVLRIASRIAEVSNWIGSVKVLKLTDDQLRIAFMRTDPAQGAWWEIYNYVSKNYADNYVAVEPEPALPTGWQSDISQTVSKSVKWVLSTDTPFNWANLDGSLMNTDWTTADKYASWTGFSSSVAASYSKFSLTLNSDNNAAVYVAPDATSTTGSYTLDEKGIYTFTGITPNFVISGGWVTLATTSSNQWRITRIEKDPTGAVVGMWVGKRDAVKPEYMVYHLIPQLGTSATDPLAAWKKALVGKTFKPDTNWFVDWINFDFSGGWTSASTFGTDFTSNGWVWTAATSKIAQSATIKFEAAGSDVKATLTQDVYDATGAIVTAGYSVSGKVTINLDIPSLTFTFPLVDYTGSPGSWLNKDNPKGAYYTKALGTNEWVFVSRGAATLGTINADGFWLGAVSNAVAASDTKDELLVFHYVLAN